MLHQRLAPLHMLAEYTRKGQRYQLLMHHCQILADLGQAV